MVPYVDKRAGLLARGSTKVTRWRHAMTVSGRVEITEFPPSLAALSADIVIRRSGGGGAARERILSRATKLGYKRSPSAERMCWIISVLGGSRWCPLDRTSQMFSGRKFRWRGRPVTREARAASAFQFWKAAALPGVDACRDPSRAPPITLAVGLPIVS